MSRLALIALLTVACVEQADLASSLGGRAPTADAAEIDAGQADAIPGDAAADNADTGAPACVPTPERCNGVDDDCDGLLDETFPQLGAPCAVGMGSCRVDGDFVCGADGPICVGEAPAPEPEACNQLDDDCDGAVDEGVGNCCQPGETRICGSAVGICVEGEQVCTLQREWSVCTADGPGEETCNGRDDDCDGQIDEGHANACGDCGPVPAEECNGQDDDCDGQTDEGVHNPCGRCGEVPPEICNGRDDDCDNSLDEDACFAYVLRPGAGEWVHPVGLNTGGPLARGGPGVDAAVGVIRGGEQIWAFSGDVFWRYDFATDRWLDQRRIDTLGGQRGGVTAAFAVPAWWGARNGGDPRFLSLNLSRGDAYAQLRIDPVNMVGVLEASGLSSEAWAGDAFAPDPNRVRALVLDLANARGWWAGRPSDFCDAGGAELIPSIGALAGEQIHVNDAGWCFVFVNVLRARFWSGFSLRRTPAHARITAWAHLNPPDGAGTHVIFTR